MKEMMSKPKVFITRTINDKALRMVQEIAEVRVWEDPLPPPHKDLLAHVQGMNGLLCLLTDPVDGTVMDEAGKQLRVISNHAVGVDNVDVEAATQRGIPVGNTPGILTETTADLAFALLLAAARRIVEGSEYVHKGLWRTWGPSLLLGQDVYGATLGIVGFGRIGQAVARRACGFKMRVLYYDPGIEDQPPCEAVKVDWDTLLAESDFITIHTTLNETTHHLFDETVFEKMKPTAILVNTARGPIVDPDALYDALQAGQIRAAALDVTEPEPLPADSKLLELDNLLVVPHIGSASHVTREKMATMAAENLIAGLQGERLPNCVNEEVYKLPQYRGEKAVL